MSTEFFALSKNKQTKLQLPVLREKYICSAEEKKIATDKIIYSEMEEPNNGKTVKKKGRGTGGRGFCCPRQ